MTTDDISALLSKLERIECAMKALLDRETRKDWYSTDEVARILGKAEFTVREWCRLGRVRAEKKGSGRGKYQSWVVSNEEVRRVQREGLLRTRAAGG